MPESIVEALLTYPEPAIRWKVRSRVLGEATDSRPMAALRDEVRDSASVLLESMRLADGWPAQARFYRTSSDIALHDDSVDWGGTSTRRANPWVTVDALEVLRAAGRIDL